MPGGFPFGDLCNGTDIGTVLGSTTAAQTLTAPGANNTKGAFTQLIASTAADCCFAQIHVEAGSGSGAINCLVDIAVGAAASEVVVCNNLFIGVPASGGGACINTYVIPLCIPAGTRISARYQTDNTGATSPTTAVQIILFDGGFQQTEGAAGIDMLGVATATSLATAVTPGASANTKGSYAQLIASTAVDYIGIIPVATGAQAGGHYLTDIAIGGAGVEQIIIPNLIETNSIGSNCQGCVGQFFPINIPAGTRISARTQHHQGSAAALSVAVAGVYQ